MDSSNKAVVKNQTALQIANYNPWNLLFSPRRRTESENSGTSTTNNYQTSKFTFYIITLSLLFMFI